MARKRGLIPASLTLANLLCGCAALATALGGGPIPIAAGLVALALLCDLLDGRAARSLGVSGPFGAQLDSLADVVSFGVAPAMTLYAWKLEAAGPAGLLGAAALIAAAATRLARFNTQTGAPPPAGPARFTGLAVTIPAIILMGAAAADVALPPAAAVALAVTLAVLMVSRLPYRSFKDRPAAVVLAPALAAVALATAATGDLTRGAGLGALLLGLTYAASAPLAHLARRAAAAR